MADEGVFILAVPADQIRRTEYDRSISTRYAYVGETLQAHLEAGPFEILAEFDRPPMNVTINAELPG